MTAMAPLPKPRGDLDALLKEYKGKIKRPMSNAYRHQLPSGKLSTPRFERKTQYVSHAYRADKKRGSAMGGCIGSSVTTAATRDYLAR